MRTPPEKFGGVFLLAKSPTALMSGKTEELTPPAADDEVDGGVELVLKTPDGKESRVDLTSEAN